MERDLNKLNYTATKSQRRMAQLLVEGEKTIVECYIEAYEQTEEQQRDRAKLSARAYSASKTRGVRNHIKRLQELQAIEEARILVWDKRKAAKFLLNMCKDIEANVEITKQLRDQMLREGLSTSQQLSQMVKVAEICNDTTRAIREVVREMNDMYGLSKPEVSLTNAIQVIIGGVNTLPEDSVD